MMSVHLRLLVSVSWFNLSNLFYIFHGSAIAGNDMSTGLDEIQTTLRSFKHIFTIVILQVRYYVFYNIKVLLIVVKIL